MPLLYVQPHCEFIVLYCKMDILTRIRVFIADIHPIVREGLKQFIAEIPDITVAGEALTQQDILDKVWTGDWDVVLLDLSLSGERGLEILKQLKIERPQLPVLVITIYPEDPYKAVQVLEIGASGYLGRESIPDQLIEAIGKIIQGGRYLNPAVVKKLALNLESDIQKPRYEVLSDREYEVMRLIALGKSMKEIAQELHLSVKIIDTYRTRILKKLRLRNKADLIRYVLQNQLLD